MAGRKLWRATLRSSSPRYSSWRDILGGDDVPLKSPWEGPTQLGAETADVYELALDQLTKEQLGRLIDWIVEKFGEPRAQVAAELAKEGFPVRAADVVVTFDLRAFL